MRKYQQKQLLEIIHTLREAHAEIKKFFSGKKSHSVLGLISDCQESAVRIGNFIAQLQGEGTKAVQHLAEYCQLLYQLSLETGSPEAGAGLIKQLSKKLYEIESSITTDLSIRHEVVFFPYKASLWDSLESIWLAAKDEPDCDAYVVPIPYFDCLPDGTLGEMHYEGNEFPDYVPIVDWKTYDIATHWPDIIFVHNPYDEDNLLTTVSPDYYCKRLKDFTNLLVYCPYSVVVDDVMEGGCVNAGTLFAHKVIVQSEKVRQTYIRTFKEFEKANNCKGAFGSLNHKFIALGSPKFDKIINSKRKDFILPEAWKKLIGDKRVVLYNTTVTAILAGNEQYLEKLRHILGTFRSKKDVILWWRPQPLGESTWQAMRPELLDEYQQIIEEYRRDRFGIYDDTADMNRAIVMSDVYYGDWSPLVALYQCTGKPILIQNIEDLSPGDLPSENAQKDNISFEKAVKELANVDGSCGRKAYEHMKSILY